MNKEDLIKSPMNYIGGKFKLLPQILPLFPEYISMFYDVFGGGGSVSLNVKSNHIYYNDIVPYVKDIFDELKSENIDESIQLIKDTIDKYSLSKTNAEGFLKLREDYNKGSNEWYTFYTLMCYSFNYQYRFNNKHQYNSSFGTNRSSFSKITEDKFRKFMERLNEIDIVFSSLDFRDIDYSDADSDDLVYFDPPYLISIGNYNDGKRGFKGWNENDEKDLLKLCDKLDKQGTRFAISNVLEHKGLSNDILKEWSKKYNVSYLNYNYGNCNYQTKDKSKTGSVEVLITNY